MDSKVNVKAPSTLFHIHEHTDTSDWLLSLCWTGLGEYSTPSCPESTANFVSFGSGKVCCGLVRICAYNLQAIVTPSVPYFEKVSGELTMCTIYPVNRHVMIYEKIT